MSSEPTIKQLLAGLGIEVRKTAEVRTRELWRGADFLGHFCANSARLRFLSGDQA